MSRRLVISLKQNGESTELVRRCYLFLLCYLMGGEIITASLLSLLRSYIAIPYKLDRVMILTVVVLCILAVIRPVLSRFPIKELFVFSFLLLAFLISWMVESGYDDMFQSMLQDFLLGAAGYILFRTVTDWARLLRWFSVMAFLITISLLVYLKIIGGLERYSMYLGYLCLGGVVISMNEAIRKRNVLHIINSVFGFVLLISMGARGPIAVSLIFLTIRLLLELKRSRFGILIVLLVAAAGWLILRNLEDIMLYISFLFERNNLSMRALQKLQRAEFLKYDNRSLRLTYVSRLISEHAFSGVGIGRDRIKIAEIYSTTLSPIGEYAHNPFFELWLQFGVILGTALILLMLWIIVRALLAKNSKEARDIVLIMLFNGFVPLMVSDSYFSRPFFFYSMAVCMACAGSQKLRVMRLRNAGEGEQPLEV